MKTIEEIKKLVPLFNIANNNELQEYLYGSPPLDLFILLNEHGQFFYWDFSDLPNSPSQLTEEEFVLEYNRRQFSKNFTDKL